MAAGETINATKGVAEFYLGIVPRVKYYFLCNECTETLSFTTDPKNADYELHSGATRLHLASHKGSNKRKDDKDDKLMRALGLHLEDDFLVDSTVRSLDHYIMCLHRIHEILTKNLKAQKKQQQRKKPHFNSAA